MFGTEADEERGVGAVPAVDRLMRVAHDAEVGAVALRCPQQPVPQRVHVLDSSDEEVPEPPPLGGGERGVVVHGVGALGEQVVEVHEELVRLWSS